MKSKGRVKVGNSINNLEDAIEKSRTKELLFYLDYNVFIKNQKIMKRNLGEAGFIMFTENRAILCMRQAPNLHIVISKDEAFGSQDFNQLLFENVEVIGSDVNKTFKVWKQYAEDIRDNFRWIIIITICFFSIYHFDAIRTEAIVALSENLLNVMGIFISMVFVFIGFIYSDSDKVVEINLKGAGDKYYMINKYIMDLSIIIILFLIFTISFGNLSKDDLPNWVMRCQMQWEYMDKFISYKTQYVICQFITWFSVCSMVICFKSLMDYYFRDLKYAFFIAAVNKKLKEWK